MWLHTCTYIVKGRQYHLAQLINSFKIQYANSTLKSKFNNFDYFENVLIDEGYGHDDDDDDNE